MSEEDRSKIGAANRFDTLIMEGKGIRGRMCHMIHWYAKVNKKYMKDYDTYNKTYLLYCDVSNLYIWAMSQKLPVNDFKRRKGSLLLKKNSYKTIMKILTNETYAKLMLSNLKSYTNYIMICHFYPRE